MERHINFMSLNKREAEYELKVRGVEPGPNQIMNRKLLREFFVRYPSLEVETSVFDPSEDLDGISQTIKDVTARVDTVETAPERRAIAKIISTINHLHFRAERIEPENEDDKASLLEYKNLIQSLYERCLKINATLHFSTGTPHITPSGAENVQSTGQHDSTKGKATNLEHPVDGSSSAEEEEVYFGIIIVTMGCFLEEERRYLSGEMTDPQSESFLHPSKITRTTVILNIILLTCSTVGFITCVLLFIGIYKDIKYLLLPWICNMVFETCVEIVNTVYLFYLQTLDFNPITSFLFTLDFFVRMLNVYAIVCVISQYQEFAAGRGTAAFDLDDRVGMVQYTAAAQHTTTTSSVPSGKRRVSSIRPLPSMTAAEPSRIDHDDVSVAPPQPIEHPGKTITSVLVKSNKPTVKKHVQFPDEKSVICLEESVDIPEPIEEKEQESSVVSSLWMEREAEALPPER